MKLECCSPLFFLLTLVACATPGARHSTVATYANQIAKSEVIASTAAEKVAHSDADNPDSRIGWRIQFRVETNWDGSGDAVHESRCQQINYSYLKQVSLVRSLTNVSGLNPRCIVSFGDYVYKFAQGTPVVEPRKICFDAYVSSPSGIANHGTGSLDCDIYVYPKTGVGPFSGNH
jgi:hypothetical protein